MYFEAMGEILCEVIEGLTKGGIYVIYSPRLIRILSSVKLKRKEA